MWSYRTSGCILITMESPLKDVNRTLMSSGLYFRKITLTVLWRIGCWGQGWTFGRHSGVRARDDTSDEKSSYSKHILKEGPAEFAMDLDARVWAQ